jgi:hypothetical protein
MELAEKRRKEYPNKKDQIIMRVKKRYQKDREKIREKQKVYRKMHKREKRVQRLSESIPIGPQCQICGAIENLEKHHPDYSKPLEVITLCRSCHRRVHLSSTPLRN